MILFPKPTEPIVGPGGLVSRNWYNYLRTLTPSELSAELAAQVAANTAAITALQEAGFGDFLPATTNVIGQGSVETIGSLSSGLAIVQLVGDDIPPGGNYVYGTDDEGIRGWYQMADQIGVADSVAKTIDWSPYTYLGELPDEADLPASANVDDLYVIEGRAWVWDGTDWIGIGAPPGNVVLSLVNDEESPGDTHYYGTDAAGDKGYHPVSDTMEAAADELTKAVDGDGVTTFGLADVTPVPGGTLQRYGFDAKGRRSEEEPAVLDDLSDVDVSGAEDGDLLTYDDASGEWLARPPAGNGTGILGTWQWAPGVASPAWGQMSAGAETSPALATELIFNRHSRTGQDHAGLLKLMGEGSTIYGQSQTDGDAWGRYEVTGASTPVGSDAASIPVTLVASGPNPLTGWAEVNFLFLIAQDASTLDHNDLSGLQGGSPTERYHLTAAEAALVPTALQPGDNVSELVNDAGYTPNALPLSGGTVTGAIISDTGAVNFEMRTSGVDRGGMQGTASNRNILWSAGGGVQIRPTARVTTSDQVHFMAGGDVLYSATIFRFLANTADGADTGRIALSGGGSPEASRGGYAVFFGNESATNPGGVAIVTGNGADMIFSGGNLRSNGDNLYSFGTGSNRWSVIYAATGAINTSDAREKTPVRPMDSQEIAAAQALVAEIGTYQWLASVEAKGDDARLHVGMTVQRAIEIMDDHDLNPYAYGFICYDRWDAQEEVTEDGEVVQPHRPAGDRYSFRMDQLILFIARGQEERLRRIEALLNL